MAKTSKTVLLGEQVRNKKTHEQTYRIMLDGDKCSEGIKQGGKEKSLPQEVSLN